MPNQHVVPNHNGGWKVEAEGSSKATLITKTKQEAIDAARKIAQNQGTELVIHGSDGKIQNKDSHGKDPFPPRG